MTCKLRASHATSNPIYVLVALMVGCASVGAQPVPLAATADLPNVGGETERYLRTMQIAGHAFDEPTVYRIAQAYCEAAGTCITSDPKTQPKLVSLPKAAE